MWMESGHWCLFGVPRVSSPDHCLLSLQLLEGNFALFCTYTLGFRNEFQNILLAIMVRMALLDPPRDGMHTIASHV